MAKFAPVVPIQIAEQLQGKTKEDDIFGDYHLILAHDVLANPEGYKRVYDRVRERFPESFIILDNSIVELGTAMEMEALLEANRIVQPDCIVIPDAMGDGEETRRLAKKFCDDYYRYTNAMIKPTPLMGVLQGGDVQDCLATYSTYTSLISVQHISVPRIIAQKQGSRVPLLVRLSNMWAFRSVHMLGFSDDLLDDISCARMPIVRGIDSAVPIRAGMNMIDITLSHNRDYGPRADYWERRISGEIEEIEVASNLLRVRRWIQPTSI
jgi:hypothetical protein